jgi:enamine deaminase RidA (YjgF/YER057c/UK114 family)
MTIQRFETGPRMSQVVVNGNTIYLAGVVANKTAGESVTKQTQEILSIIDGHLAKAGSDKSKLLSGHDLHHRHENLPGHERGMGRLGIGRQHPGARHRRGQACSAAV